jgi:hypothetical protein
MGGTALDWPPSHPDLTSRYRYIIPDWLIPGLISGAPSTALPFALLWQIAHFDSG